MITRLTSAPAHQWSRLEVGRLGSQLGAIAFVILAQFSFHAWALNHLPRYWMTVGDIALAVMLACWILPFFVYRIRIRHSIDPQDAWYDYWMQSLWPTSLIELFIHWIVLTNTGSDLDTQTLTGSMLLVSLSSIITVRHPEKGKKTIWEILLPAISPAGFLAYHVSHPGQLDGVVILMQHLFLLMMLTLREALQGSANRSYEALLAVEASRASALQAKARFLAAASHDLEQPLQSMRLFLDQFKRSSTAKERSDAERRINWSMDAMGDMVSQVTHHLQLDAGAVVARSEVVAVGPVITAVVEGAEYRAGLAGIDLITLPFSLNVRGDSTLIGRIIGNFLNNAIRHAKATRILVGSRPRGEWVRLSVTDNGRGIAEADQGTIFEAYAQGTDHADEARGGFGLGLASARQMAALMGGSVGIDPHWTSGSAFYLELPRD